MVKAAVRPTPTSPGQAVPPVFISRLINSIYFYLDTCFITPVTLSDYRLLALKGEKVLHDCKYKTLRGARGAFKRKFKKMSWHDAPAEWSHFYPPDSKWLENHLSNASLNQVSEE